MNISHIEHVEVTVHNLKISIQYYKNIVIKK
jgi:hypothetical protein